MGSAQTYPLVKPDLIFHNASAVAGNGNEYDVGSSRTLTVEIEGDEDNTARTVTFYCKGPMGVLRAIPGTKYTGDTNFTMAMNTTGTGEIWVFDVTGLDKVIMDLTSITGGTVTIKGKLIS